MQAKATMKKGIEMAILMAMAMVIAGCGDKEAPGTAAAPAPTTMQDVVPAPASAEEVAAAAEVASQTLAPTEATWTPEALEALLAPVALYPDVVLGQVLVASTNPQEVLDAGNWLLQNESLKGDALDEAAKQTGFTPPMRGLLQFPETVDMMCQELGWTEELGQAYVNDQAGVLESVQRLRAQAKDVGNLASSEQMKVETEMQANQEVIIVSPPSPEVVYVPQYDPVAVYAPAPASAVPAATTTTTVVEDKDEGHSTGTLVATGLLSFGAGLLVAEIFDDDDDDYYRGGYYNPYYYGRPPPYYPPYPYRPVYGNGYYPSHGYNRPPNYRPGGNNNTVIINQNNNYWNNYGNKPGTNPRTRDIKSPITTAKPNRSDLGALNTEASKGPKRPAPGRADSPNIKGTYAGARQPDAVRPAAASVDGAKLQGSYAGAKPKTQGTYAGAKPKTQGSYAGAKPKVAENRPEAARARPASQPAAKPAAKSASRPSANTDRGRPAAQANKPASRPAATPARTSQPSRKTATSGANRGGNDRAASARGKQSMPKGHPAKSRGNAKKQRN